MLFRFQRFCGVLSNINFLFHRHHILVINCVILCMAKADCYDEFLFLQQDTRLYNCHVNSPSKVKGFWSFHLLTRRSATLPTISEPLLSAQDLIHSSPYKKIWSTTLCTPILTRRADPLLSLLVSPQRELIHNSPHKGSWSTTLYTPLLTRRSDPLLSVLLSSQGELIHYSPHKEIWPTTLFTPLLTRRSPWSDSLLFSQEYLNCSSLYSSQGGLILSSKYLICSSPHKETWFTPLLTRRPDLLFSSLQEDLILLSQYPILSSS